MAIDAVARLRALDPDLRVLHTVQVETVSLLIFCGRSVSHIIGTGGYIERLRNTPTHICRLRYFGDENGWSLAFYKYSDEKYAPCVFHSGEWYGTPEQGFDVGAVYLDR